MAKLNTLQLQAVKATVNEDVLISAGAGSGKTATLKEKVFDMVARGEISPSSLLILTFTNNAAHEMKERIVNRFEGSENAIKILSAHIQTFDSFSQFLVKSYSKELGISDQISIANEDVLSAKTNNLLDEIFNEYYANPAQKQKILKTLVKYNMSDDKKTKAVINDLLGNLNNLLIDQREDFINNYESKFLTREFFDSNIASYIKKAKDKIIFKLAEARFVSNHFDDMNDVDISRLNLAFNTPAAFLTDYHGYSYSNEDYIQPLFEAYKELLDLEGEEFLKALSTFKVDYSAGGRYGVDLFKGGKGFDANEKGTLSVLRDIPKLFPEAISFNCSIDEQYNKLLYSKEDILLILEIVKELNKRLLDYKKVANCYTFSDIAEMAYKLLTYKEYEDVAKEIRNKFNFIMVDEYQDTNDLQEGVINSLLEVKDDGTRSHLFCVGDAKQSIYGFRNSKVELFRQRQDQYSSDLNLDESVLPMNINYRSAEQVLVDINSIFVHYMTLNHGGINYQDSIEQLQYDHKVDLYGKEKIDSRLGIQRITSISGYYDLYNPKEWEILAIIDDIKSKMSPDSDFRIYDRDGFDVILDDGTKERHHVRRAKYSDFAIIMRTKSGFDLYQKMFNEAGIPLNNKLSTRLRELDAIIVIQSLITLISHKINGDDIDYKHLVASIARSYIYQYDDQQVFDLITSDIEQIEQDKILQDINTFVDEYKEATFSDIFLNMLCRFGIVDKLYLVGNVDDNISKIESLYSMLVAQEAAGEGLTEFVKLFKDISKYDLDLSSESIYSTSNAVDMMTIHASKGLERNVVYMPVSFNKRTKGGGLASSDYKFSTKYGIMLPYYNVDELNEKDSVLFDTINTILWGNESKEHDLDIDEHVRLFYVALTRAENALIIVGDDPDFLTKNDEDVKNKESLYSMLSYLPHYYVLDEDYLNNKILAGVVDYPSLINYNQIITNIKNIRKSLSSKDFHNPMDFTNYEIIWNKYYFSKLQENMQKALSNIYQSILKNQIDKLHDMNHDSVEFYDIVSRFLGSVYFHTQFDSYDDLLEYVTILTNEESINAQIKEQEEENEVAYADEDNSENNSENDNYSGKTLTIYLEMDPESLIQILRDVANELFSIVYDKKASDMFGIGASVANSPSRMWNWMIKNYGPHFLYAFDNVESFFRLSFANESFNDNYTIFDVSKYKNTFEPEPPVKFDTSLVDNSKIDFVQRVKRRASKSIVGDEDLELQKIFDRGTQLHQYLELVDLRNINLEFIQDVNDRELINNVLNNSLMVKARVADKIYQEYGYYDELIGTTGYIDLLFVKDDEYYIVDYKSKHTDDDGYVSQLHTYQRNVMKNFGISKDKIHLYLISIYDNDIVSLECE